MITHEGPSLSSPAIDFPEVSQAEREKALARQARAKRNSDWLQAHWAELLPQACGKFVAVAGEEAFIADTPEAAWAWAEQKHPEDDTAVVQYLNPEPGVRIYAHRG